MNDTVKLDKLPLVAEIMLVLLLLAVYPLNSSAGEITAVETTTVPKFSLPDLQGEIRTLDEDGFAGKVILINFWASWCQPCIEEIPAIRQLIKTMKERQLPFEVIGINVGEAQRRVAAAARRLGINYTILLDTDSLVFDAMGAMVLPTAYVVDGNGRLRLVAQGPVEWDSVETVEILRALAGPVEAY